MKMSTHFCGQSQVLFKSTRNRTPFSLSPFSFRMAKTGTHSPHTHTWLKQNGQPGMSPPRPTTLAPPSPAVSSGRGGGGGGGLDPRVERVQSCSALPLAKATFSGFQRTVPAFGSQTHRPVPARQSFRSRGIDTL